MRTHEETANLLALGRAIRARRLKRGLTIAALARKARMSAGHLGRIERGHVNPRLPTLRDLAQALDIPTSVLFCEAEQDAEHEAGTVTAAEIAQRAIILQLLGEEHRGPWTRSELARAIPDIDPRLVGEALVQLAADGVVLLESGHVRASRCARRLDALGMVSV